MTPSLGALSQMLEIDHPPLEIWGILSDRFISSDLLTSYIHPPYHTSQFITVPLKEPHLKSMPVPIVTKSFIKPLHHQIDTRLFNQKYTTHENFWKKIYLQRFFIYLPLDTQGLKTYHIPPQDIWNDFIESFPSLYAKNDQKANYITPAIFIVCPIHPSRFIVIQSVWFNQLVMRRQKLAIPIFKSNILESRKNIGQIPRQSQNRISRFSF